MNDARKSYTVQVHKANIPLLEGESLDVFISNLSKQAGPYLIEKAGGVVGKESSAWPREVYATKAVFQVIPDWDDSSKDQLIQVDFTRSPTDGSFSFSNDEKVKLVTSYVVEKAKKPIVENVEKSLWAGVV
jgi:hypothetical protein